MLGMLNILCWENEPPVGPVFENLFSHTNYSIGQV